MALSTEQIEIVKVLLPDAEVTAETTQEQLKVILGEKYIDIELHEEAKKTAHIAGLTKGEKILKKVLGEEARGKNFEELGALVETKITTLSDQIKELEKDGGKGKNADEIEKLRKEKADLDEMLKAANDKISSLEVEVTSAKEAGETKYNQKVLEDNVRADFSSVLWTDDTKDVTKVGLWVSKIEGKYTFKNEDDYVYDNEGNVIKDPKGTGKLNRRDLFARIADEAGCLKKNGAEPGKKTVTKKPENLLPHQEKLHNRFEELKAKYAPKA